MSTPLNRTQEARAKLAMGDLRGCLAILKTFRLLTPEKKTAFRRGYECMVYPDFYQQMGKDCEKEIAIAEAAAKEYLNA